MELIKRAAAFYQCHSLTSPETNYLFFSILFCFILLLVILSTFYEVFLHERKTSKLTISPKIPVN